jgi:hypothetical protein
MNRYTVHPMPAPDTRFFILDTDTDKQVGIYHDRAAAAEQAAHYNRHSGSAVGAPITPDKPPYSPLDD